MKGQFSPSINIIRDFDKSLNYVPTENAKRVYEQIVQQFAAGVRSFTVVGSYGTGKSAFLVALAKHLNKKADYFAPVNGVFSAYEHFDFVNIVGEADSFIKSFANAVQSEETPKKILKRLEAINEELKERSTCMLLSIDEFGKFLEYAAANNPEQELYFIQQLAELINDGKSNFIFITTLHQNFDAYAAGLNKAQRQEWEKVKGRLKELSFNEPVEQLLHLVAGYLKEKVKKQESPSKNFIKALQQSAAFNLLSKVEAKLLKHLFPFDALSAMVLLKALQQYGQNERSLFHFLETQERFGINDYEKAANPQYNLACVYDYLQYNYYSTLSSPHNPHYFQWQLLRDSVDRTEVIFDENKAEALKLVKSIGLLNILGANAAKLNDELLQAYGSECLGISEVDTLLKELMQQKVIRYQKFNERYKLFHGTDVNIDRLVEEKRREVNPVTDIIAELKPAFNLNIVQAKAVTYKTGTPRLFQYKIGNTALSEFIEEEDAIDGWINLVFDETEESSIQEIEGLPILYGIYKERAYLAQLLHEIKILDEAVKAVSLDKVAKEELENRRANQIQLLNQALHEQLFGQDSVVDWYFNGKKISIESERAFNKQLSTICDTIYSATPIFHNELMNKSKPSGAIHSARKSFFEHLLEKNNEPKLGYPDKKMPADKTIYYTLLYKTGIHRDNGIVADFHEPAEESFLRLWKACDTFMDSTKVGKRPLTELMNMLSRPPYKLKQGLLDFWIGVYLYIKREDYSLFMNGAFVPKYSKDLAHLIYRNPKAFELKAFNIDGVHLDLFESYRGLTQNEETAKLGSNSAFKKIAAPFLVFYKNLPKYAQQTKRLEQKTLKFRKVLANAKDLERTFFDDIPTALGFMKTELRESKEQLIAFEQAVQKHIKALRTALDKLIDRFEFKLLQILGWTNKKFDEYSIALRKRYEQLEEPLLRSNQRVLLRRIQAEGLGRADWLKNIAHAINGKHLKNLKDSEEANLHRALESAILGLDNLLEMSKVELQPGEEVVRVQLDVMQEEPIAKNIVISAEEKEEVQSIEQRIREILPKNQKLSEAALFKLLQAYLKEE